MLSYTSFLAVCFELAARICQLESNHVVYCADSAQESLVSFPRDNMDAPGQFKSMRSLLNAAPTASLLYCKGNKDGRGMTSSGGFGSIF